MARLKMAARKRLPAKDFAVPSKRPGPGSYPIENRSHAADAKARAAGKPVAAEVDRAVARKYPDMGKRKGHGGGGSAARGEVRHPQSHEEFMRLGHDKDY